MLSPKELKNNREAAGLSQVALARLSGISPGVIFRMEITWRDLRRTFATRLIANRESIYTVQALLGHTSTRQTQRYSVLALDTLRTAVATLAQR